MPRVVECLDLGLGLLATVRLKEHVVGTIRVEGRVKVNEIDRLVLDMLAEYREVVPVEELVWRADHYPSTLLGCRGTGPDPRLGLSRRRSSSHSMGSAESGARRAVVGTIIATGDRVKVALRVDGVRLTVSRRG